MGSHRTCSNVLRIQARPRAKGLATLGLNALFSPRNRQAPSNLAFAL
jgi:hypothetical protein